MKTAIVHYWLDSYRGGEKVVEVLCELFPDADVFTHLYVPDRLPRTISRHNVKTTFIQKLPFARRLSRHYLPLMPLALEQLDLSGYDLVISSESGPAKGVVTDPDSLHICYCHSPMRYLWDQYSAYRERCGPVKKLLMAPLFHYLRQWDAVSARRVDRFVANSRFVARRIRKYYRRDARVIHPPVDVRRFGWDKKPGDYYLTISELVPYKKVDLIVRAFTRSGRPLLVIGDGSEKPKLQRLAGPNVRLLGHVPDETLETVLQGCRALVYAATEDFGIVPVEAQAAGRPVIAYDTGGTSETVLDGVTGILFNSQTPDAINRAVEKFENKGEEFSARRIRKHAERFARDKFLHKMRAFISDAFRDWQDSTGLTEHPNAPMSQTAQYPVAVPGHAPAHPATRFESHDHCVPTDTP
jgi:glycosyltransferase involved in cell wall biosynthesis